MKCVTNTTERIAIITLWLARLLADWLAGWLKELTRTAQQKRWASIQTNAWILVRLSASCLPISRHFDIFYYYLCVIFSFYVYFFLFAADMVCLPTFDIHWAYLNKPKWHRTTAHTRTQFHNLGWGYFHMEMEFSSGDQYLCSKYFFLFLSFICPNILQMRDIYWEAQNMAGKMNANKIKYCFASNATIVIPYRRVLPMNRIVSFHWESSICN